MDTTASITLTVPLSVDLPRKRTKDKRIYLSRNVYDNLHFQIRNQVKEAVRSIVDPQLDQVACKLHEPVQVSMQLFPSRATSDLGNFCDVLSKIVQDCVVRYGCLQDDSIKYLKRETREAMPCDPCNPRLVLTYSSIV